MLIVIYGFQNKEVSLSGSKDRRFGLRKRKKEGKVWHCNRPIHCLLSPFSMLAYV